MKSDEEISTADSAQIESLIERVKQGKLEQNDAQLIKRLLRTFLTLITLLQRKNTTIKRLKQLFLGPQEKKGKGQSDATTRTTTTDQEKTSESGSSDEAASSSRSEGEAASSKSKQFGHGRKPASAYTGARVVRLSHPTLSVGDRRPDPTCEGRLHKLEKPKTKIYLTGQPLISATKFERPVFVARIALSVMLRGFPMALRRTRSSMPQLMSPLRSPNTVVDYPFIDRRGCRRAMESHCRNRCNMNAARN